MQNQYTIDAKLYASIVDVHARVNVQIRMYESLCDETNSLLILHICVACLCAVAIMEVGAKLGVNKRPGLFAAIQNESK